MKKTPLVQFIVALVGQLEGREVVSIHPFCKAYNNSTDFQVDFESDKVGFFGDLQVSYEAADKGLDSVLRPRFTSAKNSVQTCLMHDYAPAGTPLNGMQMRPAVYFSKIDEGANVSVNVAYNLTGYIVKFA